MKKLLAGLCAVVLSGQAFAYQGATLDFTKEIFQAGMTSAIADNTQDTNKYDCAVKTMAPSLDIIAQRYLGTVLTKREVTLLDKFFDTPLGQDMFNEIRSGNIQNFGANINLDKYDDSEYEQYFEAFDKLFDNDEVDEAMSSDEFIRSVVDAVVDCKLYE